MTLRVGFDLDGVLADFRSAFAQLAREVLHVDIEERSPEGPSRSAGALDRVWQAIGKTHNWWTRLEPFEPDQIRRLYALSREGPWEVVFLTKRPASAGDTVQFQTQWWLEQQGFLLPAVITVPGSRGELANALRLDLIVDDQLINCAEVRGASTTKAVLVLRDGDSPSQRDHAIQRGIGVVSTLAQALDVAHQLEEELPRRRGRMLRLSDWFSRKAEPERLEPEMPRPTVEPR